jgi:hypothetical protein
MAITVSELRDRVGRGKPTRFFNDDVRWPIVDGTPCGMDGVMIYLSHGTVEAWDENEEKVQNPPTQLMVDELKGIGEIPDSPS